MNWKIYYPLTKELSSHRTFYLLYLSAVAFLTILFTWPVVLHMSSSIYGYSGDSFGFIYYLWLWKDHFLRGMPLDFNPLVMAPFGTIFAPETGTVVFYWPTKIIALLSNPVFSYNFNLLLSFFFSALAAYLFVYELCRNRVTAALFGLVFAFSPYHFWKAYNHLDLAMIQYIPIFFWSLIRLKKNPSWRAFLLSGLSLALLVLLNFYYGYFGLLTIGLFALFIVLENLRRRALSKDLKYFLLLPFLGIILASPFVIGVFSPSAKANLPQSRQETYDRPLDNLLLLSARPWSYVLPSIDNPFLGSVSSRTYKSIATLSKDFKTQMPFPNEVTVYLGFFSLGFFALSLWFCWRRKIERGLIPLILFVAGGLFLVSMPPFIIIKSVTIYLPTFFLHQIFPMFRAYGRLGIFILPLIGGVAAFGYSRLLERSSPKLKLVVIGLSVLLIFLEFANTPPSRVTTTLPLPAAYAWLSNQSGDFTIMEYPKEFNLADGEFYQMYHGKKIANWYSTYPYYNLWPFVEDIYNPQSYEILSSLGIKYVLFHKKLLFPQPNPVDGLWSTRAFTAPIKYQSLPRSLVRIQAFDSEDIFEIKAEQHVASAVFTAQRYGGFKTEILSGQWSSVTPSRIYLLNISGQTITGALDTGSGKQTMEIPQGRTSLDLKPGSYNLSFSKL